MHSKQIHLEAVYGTFFSCKKKVKSIKSNISPVQLIICKYVGVVVISRKKMHKMFYLIRIPRTLLENSVQTIGLIYQKKTTKSLLKPFIHKHLYLCEGKRAFQESILYHQ